MDNEGYLIARNGKKYVRVDHEHKEAKFKTPASRNEPVQKVDEVLSTTKKKVTTDIRKRQINAKTKHRGEFEKEDGSAIVTSVDFRDPQVRYLQDEKNPSKYLSDCLLLGDGSEPVDAACVIDDDTRACMVLRKVERWNRELKIQEYDPVLEYVGPRLLSPNQYERFKRYGVIGSDGKDISQAYHGMSAKELTEIRSQNPLDSDYWTS